MFKEAAELGASTIRLDIAVSQVFSDPNGPPDWSGVDEYAQLARRYRLRVLANLLGTPWYLGSWDAHYPPSDPGRWGRLTGLIAARTRGAIESFEIINEPDGSWAFRGTPQQYAAMLAASYDAIHQANPSARVALGGLMRTGDTGWIETMLATEGVDAVHKFDIANIHVRGRAQDAGAIVSAWRRYFASKGFEGPLWVTEAGYPAHPSFQTDPAYRGGAGAQARYLGAAVPAMVRAGADKVFVTERDSLSGGFASEGVLDSDDPLTAHPRYTRRPSFYTLRNLAKGLSAQPDQTLPTNTFSLGRTRMLPNGSARLDVRVPGPGALSAENAHTAGKAKRRPALITHTRKRARTAGTVTLILRPTTAAKRRLRRGSTVQARVKVTFKPTGGIARSKTTPIRLCERKRP